MILLLVCILQLPVLSEIQEHQSDSSKEKLTVARVMDKPQEGYTEVIFLESARYYKLLHSNAHYSAYLLLLKDSGKNKSALEVRFTRTNGDTIEAVYKPKRKT